MTRVQVLKSGLAALSTVAILLAGAGGAMAGDTEEKSAMEHSHMAGSETMEQEEGMMAMHEKMHAKMEAMDSKLVDLVAKMETASGDQKTEAIAAVVSELVRQRHAMRGMMMKMQPAMMEHMMEHMASGMMQGMQQNMAGCPMMKQKSSPTEEGGEDEHSAHHPDR